MVSKEPPAWWRGLCWLLPGLERMAGYRRAWWKYDLAAGLSVAAIALPVGIAYADLADVPPVVGMYSAIFPLIVYAFIGSSRQLMTGPDAATCVITAASLGALAGGDGERYLALLMVLTLLTGLVYLAAGVLRLGFIANFLSQPILTGYLNGIALLIIVSQLPKLFGVAGDSAKFFEGIWHFAEQLGQTNAVTLVMGLILLAVLVAFRVWLPRWPAPLVVVVLGIGVVFFFGLEARNVEVLGHVPAGLPSFHWQVFAGSEYLTLLRDALGIGLVSFTSGILTAKSFARRNRYDLDANRELSAYGASNLVTGLLSGYPVTGADSRTAVNDAMGGKTQVTGLVAAGAMLLILFFLTQPLAYVPQAALAAVIIVAAVGLFDLKSWVKLFRISHLEFAFSVGTTLGVLVLGVLPGVLLAVLLTVLNLLREIATPHATVLGRVKELSKSFHSLEDYPDAKTYPGLLLFRFESSLVFFNAEHFQAKLKEAVVASDPKPKWVIVDASTINLVDLTAVEKIDELRAELQEAGIRFGFAHLRQDTAVLFRRAGVLERIGPDYLFPSLTAAVKRYKHLGLEQ
ncbi:MAG: sulfate permease [Verrucomicrobiota bacterium]